MFGLSKPPSKALAGAKLAQQQNLAPDSIPGMFKPGEFVLPPDTVHAMGGKQALQGVVDATHTQVPEGFGLNPEKFRKQESKPAPGLGLHRKYAQPADPALVPQLGLRPDVFFANGGAPEDQVQQPGLGLKPSAAPSPGNTFPGNRLQGSSGFSGAPVAAPAPAPAAPKPVQAGMTDSQLADALAQIPTGGPKAPTADGSQNTWTNTEAGRNFGNAAAALPGIGGLGRVASTGGAISKGINAVSTAANNVGRVANSVPVVSAGLYGVAAPAAAATVPAPTTATGPGAGQGRGLINPPLVKPAAVDSSLAQPPAAAGNQVLDGVYNHGRGQYSDQAGGMGLPAGFTGQPNAQSDAAARALAQSGGFGLHRPAPVVQEQPGLGLYGGGQIDAGGQPAWSGSIGQSTGNGNMWSRTPEQQRRDAEVQASSIHRQTAANGRAALTALGNQELESMRGSNALAQESMRQVGGLHRTAMTEAGANQRAALGESGANVRAAGQVGLGLQRLSIDQQRINNDERLRAPQIRAAERLGQLQDAYIGAKTPEEQAAISAQIRAYSGKEDADWKVQVTPATKNVDGSTTAGSVIRYNSRTGDVQDVGASKPALPPGMTKQVGSSGGKPVYEDAKGNRFVGE